MTTEATKANSLVLCHSLIVGSRIDEDVICD
jgi:hypothetical protein